MKYKPMMAHGAKDADALLKDSDFVAEIKWDGIRGMLECFGGEPHLYSRLGNDRISDAAFLVEAMDGRETDVVLDGELYLPDGTSSDVADKANEDKLLYVAYDVLFHDGQEYLDHSYSERMKLLDQIVAQIGHPRVQLTVVSEQPSDLLEVMKDMGREGIMMKRKSGVYRPGKRSWDWQKIKIHHTASVIITGADAPPSKWTVTPGNYGTDGVFYPDGKPTSTSTAGFVGLTYGFWIDGEPQMVGKLGVTGSKDEMEQHVGKVAEVKHYGQYPSTMALRHVQFLGFRDDIRSDECVANQMER